MPAAEAHELTFDGRTKRDAPSQLLDTAPMGRPQELPPALLRGVDVPIPSSPQPAPVDRFQVTPETSAFASREQPGRVVSPFAGPQTAPIVQPGPAGPPALHVDTPAPAAPGPSALSDLDFFAQPATEPPPFAEPFTEATFAPAEPEIASESEQEPAPLAAAPEPFGEIDAGGTPSAEAPWEALQPAPSSFEPPEPLVSSTLAELYREQGHLSDARQALELLASSETDPERARALLDQVEGLPEAPPPETLSSMGRLRDLLDRLPARLSLSPRSPEDVLGGLVSEATGIRGAALADRAGLAIVSAGAVDESLVGEMTALYNSIDRSRHEVGSGALAALALRGEDAGAMIASLVDGYSLVLSTIPGAPIGRLRYEVSRAADELRPGLV